jgi:hypothetical protein
MMQNSRVWRENASTPSIQETSYLSFISTPRIRIPFLVSFPSPLHITSFFESNVILLSEPSPFPSIRIRSHQPCPNIHPNSTAKPLPSKYRISPRMVNIPYHRFFLNFSTHMFPSVYRDEVVALFRNLVGKYASSPFFTLSITSYGY